jgi:triacylglycerol lipase
MAFSMLPWIAIVLALLVLATIVVAVVARRGPGERAVDVADLTTRYPVVMLHGIMGFDEIGVARWKQTYFRGIAEHLQSRGAIVYRPRLPAMSSIPERAERLASFLRTLPVERVNIIAHSMGGLDARYAIARLAAGDKVASLITIGTPHFGTPLADFKDSLPGAALRRLAGGIGVNVDGFQWLTVDSMSRFNAEVFDDDRVLYACVVTRAKPATGINPLLLPSEAYLRRRAGSNDGIVPATSQRWGEVLMEIDADHYAQVGWTNTFDAAALYASLVETLRTRGY